MDQLPIQFHNGWPLPPGAFVGANGAVHVGDEVVPPLLPIPFANRPQARKGPLCPSQHASQDNL